MFHRALLALSGVSFLLFVPLIGVANEKVDDLFYQYMSRKQRAYELRQSSGDSAELETVEDELDSLKSKFENNFGSGWEGKYNSFVKDSSRRAEARNRSRSLAMSAGKTQRVVKGLTPSELEEIKFFSKYEAVTTDPDYDECIYRYGLLSPAEIANEKLRESHLDECNRLLEIAYAKAYKKHVADRQSRKLTENLTSQHKEAINPVLLESEDLEELESSSQCQAVGASSMQPYIEFAKSIMDLFRRDVPQTPKKQVEGSASSNPANPEISKSTKSRPVTSHSATSSSKPSTLPLQSLPQSQDAGVVLPQPEPAVLGVFAMTLSDEELGRLYASKVPIERRPLTELKVRNPVELGNRLKKRVRDAAGNKADLDKALVGLGNILQVQGIYPEWTRLDDSGDRIKLPTSGPGDPETLDLSEIPRIKNWVQPSIQIYKEKIKYKKPKPIPLIVYNHNEILFKRPNQVQAESGDWIDLEKYEKKESVPLILGSYEPGVRTEYFMLKRDSNGKFIRGRGGKPKLKKVYVGELKNMLRYSDDIAREAVAYELAKKSAAALSN